MINIFDFTFKKILKIARALSIFKTLLFLVGGIIILVYNEQIEQYIYLIVGFYLIATSSIEIMTDIVNRNYRKSHTHLGSAVFTMVLGILILTTFHEDVYIVSVMWAVSSIVGAVIEINEGMHELNERKAFSIINLGFAVTEIVFSILLLIEPEENVEHYITHIYLLGVGFILESFEALLSVFSPFLAKVPVVNALPGIGKLAEERKEELALEKEADEKEAEEINSKNAKNRSNSKK